MHSPADGQSAEQMALKKRTWLSRHQWYRFVVSGIGSVNQMIATKYGRLTSRRLLRLRMDPTSTARRVSESRSYLDAPERDPHHLYEKTTERRSVVFPAYLYLWAFVFTCSRVLRCLSSFGSRISSMPCFSWASASSIATSSGSRRVREKLPQNSSRW